MDGGICSTLGLRFAGRDPMLREPNSSSGVAVRKYLTNDSPMIIVR